MWQLKLDKYYYEAVALTPYWFIAEFLEETVDSLRFSKSFDVIHQVKDLVGAFYTNICRMDYRTSKPGLNDQKLVLEKYIEWISSCLRHYNTPVTEETVTKSKIKTKQYTGHSLNCQISLVLNCLKLFQNKPTFEFDKKFNIYKIYLEKEPEVNNFSVNKYSSAVYEALTQINVILLNTLQNSLLNVTCDDFMFWVEVDIEDNTIEDEDLKRDNLQKLIGEQAYELINIMKGNPDLEHNVIVQLSSISLKPQTLAEVAKESPIGTVLEKIETSKSRRVWLEELLNRRETVYFNTECLQTIIDNIEIVGYGHLTKILRDHQEFDSEQDDEILLNEIFLKGGQRLEIGDLKAFVDELINALGIDYCISSETEIVQEHEITNYLNKITEENLEMGNMWKLILQNPQKFYEKLLENVDSQDESQISTILTLISITCPISNCFIKKQISKEIDEAVKNEKSPRHLLLAGIFKLNIFERKEFVKDLLMMNFSQALSGYTNMNNLLTSLKTLKALTNHLKVSDLLPPLLIQLAQILDKYRWDLLTYSSSREEVVEITISIIQDLTKIVVINGTKNEKDWIKSKIDSLKMMTKFYYQKLSLEKGEAIIPLDKYLHPTEFSNIPKVKITSFLCENIVRCTSKEVRKLMNNENLLNFYTESLSVLSTIVRKSNQKNADECLRKYVTDYVKILSVSIA